MHVPHKFFAAAFLAFAGLLTPMTSQAQEVTGDQCRRIYDVQDSSFTLFCTFTSTTYGIATYDLDTRHMTLDIIGEAPELECIDGERPRCTVGWGLTGQTPDSMTNFNLDGWGEGVEERTIDTDIDAAWLACGCEQLY